jgi:hypothetical protein
MLSPLDVQGHKPIDSIDDYEAHFWNCETRQKKQKATNEGVKTPL